MYLIVGLGNPESEYSGTRHNMGFDAINAIAKKLDLGFFNFDSKADAQILRAKIFDKDVLFLKPQTYMNLSGESIRRVVNYYKIEEENIIIAYDDMDTPKGKIRIRENGGAGGHNGIKSVLSVVRNFTRVRIGIGRCAIDSETAKIHYVTSRIPDEEKEILKQGSDEAADAIIDILKTDIQSVMNKYNKKDNFTEAKDRKVEDVEKEQTEIIEE